VADERRPAGRRSSFNSRSLPCPRRAHSSSGLGRRPLTAVARVRIPYAPPRKTPVMRGFLVSRREASQVHSGPREAISDLDWPTIGPRIAVGGVRLRQRDTAADERNRNESAEGRAGGRNYRAAVPPPPHRQAGSGSSRPYALGNVLARAGLYPFIAPKTRESRRDIPLADEDVASCAVTASLRAVRRTENSSSLTSAARPFHRSLASGPSSGPPRPRR
jgi:hypothetical protein